MDSIPEERYYRYTLNVNGRRVALRASPADYSTSVLTRKALGFTAPPTTRSSSTSHRSHRTSPRSRSAGQRLYRRAAAAPLAAFDEATSPTSRGRRASADVHSSGVSYDLERSGAPPARTLRSLDRRSGRSLASSRRRSSRPDGDRLRQRQRVPVGRASTRAARSGRTRSRSTSPRDPDAVATRGRHRRSPPGAQRRSRADRRSAAGVRPGIPQDGRESRASPAARRTLRGASTGSSSTAGPASSVGGPPPYRALARIGFSTSPTTTAGASCTTCDATRGSSTTSRARDATLSRSATSPVGSPFSRRRRRAAVIRAGARS